MNHIKRKIYKQVLKEACVIFFGVEDSKFNN